MDTVNILINGTRTQVPAGTTILEAAKSIGIMIPTLCYLKGINEEAHCRMCLVEIKGEEQLQTSCASKVSEGMEVHTNSDAVLEARKQSLELILSRHNRSCLTCVRSLNCELQNLAEEMSVKEIRYGDQVHRGTIDQLSPSIVRDSSKCIGCGRCVSMCKMQTVEVIKNIEKDGHQIASTLDDLSLNELPCALCGQCVAVCPVGALREKDDVARVWDALNDDATYVMVQTAPAVRVALGEEFGLPIGSRVTPNMVSALKKIGFDRVYDTDTAADLTIMEEGTELLHRIKEGGTLPLITSCSPGWIKFCEHNYPDFLDNLSSCKSPHQMFGAVLKSYYAEREGIDPAKIFVVSVMPCTAKKFEAQRPELSASGYPDVDAVLTTRELARMIKEADIDFSDVSDAQFDDPMGEASGAAVIFGATGGVMEAALRTVSEILEGKEFENIEYNVVRGLEGIKEAIVEIGGLKIKAAVAHGLGNARALLEKIRAGEDEYHFVEVMACPGGCVNGGGQPIQPSQVRNDVDLRMERAKAIYAEDRSLPVRKSHENPKIKMLYDEYFEKPGSHKAHKILHTHYIARENTPAGGSTI